MGAADLRQAAAGHRQQAQELLGTAQALESEAPGLLRAFRRVWPAFVPETWDGPAARRAHDGLVDAQRDVRRSAELVNVHALDLRRRAIALEQRAAHLEAQARATELAAQARALELAAQARALELAAREPARVASVHRRVGRHA